jgi:hypothetical protein
MGGESSMELKNEFAHVRVLVDAHGNGPRLMIEDVRTGKVGYLDPLELETLAWVRHEQLAPLMDPSATRWSSDF